MCQPRVEHNACLNEINRQPSFKPAALVFCLIPHLFAFSVTKCDNSNLGLSSTTRELILLPSPNVAHILAWFFSKISCQWCCCGEASSTGYSLTGPPASPAPQARKGEDFEQER